jgi:thiamine-monophosphate kinase
MKEFTLIDKYFRPLATGFAGAYDLRDDAAVLPVPDGQELVVTKDMIVAGVHFLGAEPAHLIAQKALRVNLSDLAAKGAKPYAYSLGLALTAQQDEKWIAHFGKGLAQDQQTFQIALIGGDTVKAPHDLTISITAYGLVPKGQIIRRGGAKVGDGIYVTGTIGDAGLGLGILQNRFSAANEEEAEYFKARYYVPQPRLGLLGELRPHVTAAIDISDGLLADLGHLCKTSAKGAEIHVEKLKLHPATKRFFNESGLQWRDVLAFGDDYELLFTLDPAHEGVVQNLSLKYSYPVTKIGIIGANNKVKVLDEVNKELNLETSGYEHKFI